MHCWVYKICRILKKTKNFKDYSQHPLLYPHPWILNTVNQSITTIDRDCLIIDKYGKTVPVRENLSSSLLNWFLSVPGLFHFTVLWIMFYILNGFSKVDDCKHLRHYSCFLFRWWVFLSDLPMWGEIHCLQGWSGRSELNFLWYVFTDCGTSSSALNCAFLQSFKSAWSRGHSGFKETDAFLLHV